MKKRKLWVTRGSKEFLSYDFLFKKEISFEELSNYQINEIKSIEKNKETIAATDQWLELISLLPCQLYLILESEINHGNVIKSIGQVNWPNKGSIVIQLTKPFQIENRRKFNNVNWHPLNDHIIAKKNSRKTQIMSSI